MPSKDEIYEIEAEQDGKKYVIAYSLREQKRANDLKEIELKQRKEWQLIVLGICIFLFIMIAYFVFWLHTNNIPTRVLG